MKKEHLIQCFKNAIDRDVRYVGVKLEYAGFESVTIYHKKDFEYVIVMFEEELKKDLTYRGAKVTGFAYGEHFYVVEEYLRGDRWR